MNQNERAAARLVAKVEAYNQLGRTVNQWVPILRDFLKAWIGKKVKLATGVKTKAFQEALDTLNLPHTNSKEVIFIQCTSYSMFLHCRAVVNTADGSCQYAEADIFLGSFAHDSMILTELNREFPTFRTDYKVETILALRRECAEAQEKAREAEAALGSFGEYDR